MSFLVFSFLAQFAHVIAALLGDCCIRVYLGCSCNHSPCMMYASVVISTCYDMHVSCREIMYTGVDCIIGNSHVPPAQIFF